MSFPILGHARFTHIDSSGDPYDSGSVSILEPNDDTNKTYYPTAADADAGTNGATGDVSLNSAGRTETKYCSGHCCCERGPCKGSKRMGVSRRSECS